MQMSGVLRSGLMLLAAGLFLVTGCRSTTDRMRVLEAEKADANRRNQELKNREAELRASLIESQSEAESEIARRRAAEARLALLMRRPEEPPAATKTPTVNITELRDRLGGSGIRVEKNGQNGAKLTLPADITFRPGKADLTSGAERNLRRVVLALKQTPGIRGLRIDGHTDADPIRKSGWADNRELSLARAEIVRTYLISRGLDETLMQVEGHGAEQPVDSNKTREGKARNRRVEIILVTR